MTTELIRFTQWAKNQPQKRFTALMGLLAAPEGLGLYPGLPMTNIEG